VIPLSRYYCDGRRLEQGCLLSIPAYQLARIRGEALAILECRPEARWLLNQCCVVVGYVEAFAYYDPGAFPWPYLVEKLRAMRRFVSDSLIVRAPRVQAKREVKEEPPSRLVRYEGRMVSRVWYGRHVRGDAA
jgi:hypothetical protein